MEGTAIYHNSKAVQSDYYKINTFLTEFATPLPRPTPIKHQTILSMNRQSHCRLHRRSRCFTSWPRPRLLPCARVPSVLLGDGRKADAKPEHRPPLFARSLHLLTKGLELLLFQLSHDSVESIYLRSLSLLKLLLGGPLFCLLQPVLRLIFSSGPIPAPSGWLHA